MRLYKEDDVTTNLIRGAPAAVVGYGNQGHAHALNLRDSGVNVIVGARPDGKAWRRAEDDGFEPRDVSEAVAAAEYVALLLPDEVQSEVYARDIAPRFSPGMTLVFAHGFGVEFGSIGVPEGCDLILVAPKGQGHYVRKSYTKGSGVPCLVAVEEDASGRAFQKALSYAQALGCLRVGAIETTFREEAVTDLFGEQAVLCGGVPALVKAAFDTLVEGGYPPEVAYIECLHELKIITDLMIDGGVTYMKERISRTAAWGSYLAEDRVVSEELKSTMTSLLEKIESGEFAHQWLEEAASGAARLGSFIDDESKHPIERAGISARAFMEGRKEENS
jgi:ketol-acid reductoisomerase